MSIGEQFAILWMMFKEWLSKVFGGGIDFDTNGVSGYAENDDEEATKQENAK